ncbi:hypothetical protein T439DRAFT_331975 [Meredithblackwellia eburnea MCA 4105]
MLCRGLIVIQYLVGFFFLVFWGDGSRDWTTFVAPDRYGTGTPPTLATLANWLTFTPAIPFSHQPNLTSTLIPLLPPPTKVNFGPHPSPLQVYPSPGPKTTTSNIHYVPRVWKSLKLGQEILSNGAIIKKSCNPLSHASTSASSGESGAHCNFDD